MEPGNIQPINLPALIVEKTLEEAPEPPPKRPVDAPRPNRKLQARALLGLSVTCGLGIIYLLTLSLEGRIAPAATAQSSEIFAERSFLSSEISVNDRGNAQGYDFEGASTQVTVNTIETMPMRQEVAPYVRQDIAPVQQLIETIETPQYSIPPIPLRKPEGLQLRSEEDTPLKSNAHASATQKVETEPESAKVATSAAAPEVDEEEYIPSPVIRTPPALHKKGEEEQAHLLVASDLNKGDLIITEPLFERETIELNSKPLRSAQTPEGEPLHFVPDSAFVSRPADAPLDLAPGGAFTQVPVAPPASPTTTPAHVDSSLPKAHVPLQPASDRPLAASGDPKVIAMLTGQSPLSLEKAVDSSAESSVAAHHRIKVAVIMSAAGLHVSRTRRAIEELPSTVTFAFAPIGPSTRELAQLARRDGHQVLVEIPMEPKNYPHNDPGPLTLLRSSSSEENINRLNTALEIAPFADGISTYQGAGFSHDQGAVRPLLTAYAARGGMVFENQPTARSNLGEISNSLGIRYAQGNAVIDKRRSALAINEALVKIELEALQNGSAIAIASVYNESITALKEWISGLQAKGITLVSVTDIAG